MTDHIAQVRVYRHSQLFESGDPVAYDGPPAWQFEPIDPRAKAAWLKSHADPLKVRETNWRAAGMMGDPMAHMPAYAAEMKRTKP